LVRLYCLVLCVVVAALVVLCVVVAALVVLCVVVAALVGAATPMGGLCPVRVWVLWAAVLVAAARVGIGAAVVILLLYRVVPMGEERAFF